MKTNFYNKIKIIILLIFLSIFYQSNAHAYLDPGTGSFILQLIVGLIASIGATAAFYWRKIKLFLKKIFKKKEEKKRPNK